MLEHNDLRTPHDEQFPELSKGDFITHKFIRTDLRAHDLGLYQSKWFDYRFMTPIEATLVFIDAMGKASQRIYAADIDMEKAQHIRWPTGANVLERLLNERLPEKESKAAKARFSGFWRARACADATGMPYTVYVESVIRTRMRAWARAEIPTATQLYNRIDVEKAMARWDELQRSSIHYSDHYAYLPANYRGTAPQVDYTRYLIGEARKRQLSDVLLRQMIEDDKLSPAGLQAEVGAAEFKRIVETRTQNAFVSAII